MENYYFIQKKGIKQGPFKLQELKQQTIFFDELIWRSDNDQWKKATEFEELQGIFIIKPPLTPKEEKKKDLNDNFFTTILPYTLGLYIILSLIVSVSSFSIANKSWEDEKGKYLINKEEIGKDIFDFEGHALDSITEQLKNLRSQYRNIEKYETQIWNGPRSALPRTKSEKDSLAKYYSLRTQISFLIQDSLIHNTLKSFGTDNIFNSGTSNSRKIEPIYSVPENVISLENMNAYNQSFLFRPFYAFFSKIYLTREEQTDSGKLYINLLMSSLTSLFLIIFIALIAYYSIEKAKIKA